jgi:hypothetical protein
LYKALAKTSNRTQEPFEGTFGIVVPDRGDFQQASPPWALALLNSHGFGEAISNRSNKKFAHVTIRAHLIFFAAAG